MMDLQPSLEAVRVAAHAMNTQGGGAMPGLFVVECSSVDFTVRHERATTLMANDKEDSMFLVRDIMYCKPGQARPMVQKFLALNKLGQKMGFGPMRVMTDVSAERYWTVISEMEVESLEKYAEMTRTSMGNKDFQEAMKGYHDLVDHGRREIYAIET